MATVSGLGFPIFSPTSGRGLAHVTSLQMEWQNMGITARHIDKLGMDIRSMREPLKRAVQKVIIPSIRLNFLKYGRPEKWQPITTETAQKKGNYRILRDTDALMNTMGLLKIWHIDHEKALIPSLPQDVWYGYVHQFGIGHSGPLGGAFIRHDTVEDLFTNVGDPGAIPARPFALIQKEDEVEIERLFGEWLEERINRNMLGPARRTVR